MTALLPRVPLAVSPCAWCRNFPCVCIRERSCVCGGVIVVMESMEEAVREHQRSTLHRLWREVNGL